MGTLRLILALGIIAKFYASVSESIVDDGVFLMEECDRIYPIFVTMIGYKRVLPEYVAEDSVVLTLHAGYDVKRGMVRRAAIDFI